MRDWRDCPNGPHPSRCPDCPEAFPCACCRAAWVENDGDWCWDCTYALDSFIAVIDDEEVFA